MKILVFPRDRNPYQESVYAILRERGVRVRYVGEVSRSHSFNVLLLPFEVAFRRLRGYGVLHIHWIYPFALPLISGTKLGRILSRGWYQFFLFVLQKLDFTVVWTAHNVLPHERVFEDDKDARRALLRTTKGVVAHSEYALRELRAFADLPILTTVIRHPAYDVPTSTVRCDHDSIKLLYFGTIDLYKGVPDLIEAASHLGRVIKLTVAGDYADKTSINEFVEMCKRAGVTCLLGRQSDDSLFQLVSDCDIVVLPFRRVTTSGSALFAMSSGRGLVIPNLPALSDLPPSAVRRYDIEPNPVTNLTNVLRDLAGSPTEVIRMGEEAARWARQCTWFDLADTLEEISRRALSV